MSKGIPIPITLGGLGFLLAIAVPGGVSGGFGFLIGLVLGGITVVLLSLFNIVVEQNRLTKRMLAEVESIGSTLRLERNESPAVEKADGSTIESEKLQNV